MPHCVFGLGNTQYEFYNAMGKLVAKKLGEAGGEKVVDYGEGDDDKNLEEDFEAWKDEKFWPALEPLAGEAGGSDKKVRDVCVQRRHGHFLIRGERIDPALPTPPPFLTTSNIYIYCSPRTLTLSASQRAAS